MRMSDEQYFRSCVAKERHLAQLLGHQHIEELSDDAGTLWENRVALPKWTRDWCACGPLLVQFELTPVFRREPGETESSSVSIGPVTAQFSDHPSREQAVRCAIVKAAIHLLEHPAARRTPSAHAGAVSPAH